MSHDQLWTNGPSDVVIVKTASLFFFFFFLQCKDDWVYLKYMHFLFFFGVGLGGGLRGFKSVLLCFEHLKFVLLGVVGFVIRLEEVMEVASQPSQGT
jgi:hypothetical protein